MELKYSLTENDYLQQQLYLASKSNQINKQRKRARIAVPIILLVIVFLSYFNENLFEAYCSAGAGIVWFFLFPIYLKRYYQRVFKKYVNENFKDRAGIVLSIAFKENALEVVSENIGKSEFNFSSFKNISEIENYFFIDVKASGNIMIPKAKIDNVEAVKNKLKTIAEKQGIEFISELDWKWK